MCTLAGITGDMQHGVIEERKGNHEEIHTLSDEDWSSSSESAMLLEDKEGTTQCVYNSILLTLYTRFLTPNYNH